MEEGGLREHQKPQAPPPKLLQNTWRMCRTPVADACARRNSVCDRATAGHRGRWWRKATSRPGRGLNTSSRSIPTRSQSRLTAESRCPPARSVARGADFTATTPSSPPEYFDHRGSNPDAHQHAVSPTEPASPRRRIRFQAYVSCHEWGAAQQICTRCEEVREGTRKFEGLMEGFPSTVGL